MKAINKLVSLISYYVAKLHCNQHFTFAVSCVNVIDPFSNDGYDSFRNKRRGLSVMW